MSTNSEKSIIYRHLPLTLIQHSRKHAKLSPVWGHWLDGTLMHCDVTGFTAMSEALARSGNEGAEFMANILNRFFETMLGIADEKNGVQMKFGGDAMLLYFGGADHAARAAASGLDMQHAMSEFRDISVFQNTYTLMMRIGIHSGRFYSASVGQTDNLLHYILLGYDVNKTADVEPLAEPGQVVLSSATRDLLDEKFKLTTTAYDNIWQVVRHNFYSPSTPRDTDYNDNTQLLKRYLMPAIANNSVATLSGEHRRVTIVFIYLVGSSEILEAEGEAIILEQINQYINFVLEGILKFGGNFITSDVSEHGDKLLLSFGAPTSCENQEENAVRFACELNSKLEQSNLTLTHQIGINSGHVFAGEIGAKNRCEFTTIGDTTNLAARLMGAAGADTIIASATTAEKCAGVFDMTALEPITVKGKSQPIPIYRINKVQEHVKQLFFKDNNSPLCGRDSEFDQLTNIASHTQEGNCSIVHVAGESGIGKSRLCFEFSKMLHDAGWLSTSGVCQSHTKNSAYSSWNYPLRRIMGITVHDTNDAALKKIATIIEQFIPDLIVFTPLIADMLSIEHKSNPLIDSLDASTKREKRIYTIVQLLEAISSNKPIFIFFDNAQWIDNLSVELFSEIMSLTSSQILFCIASRNKLDNNFYANGDNVIQLVLDNLSNSDAKDLLLNLEAPPETIKLIIERAKGNPLFLEELAKSNLTTDRSMPESVYDVVMSRLDHLDARKKSILKTTSVIGQIFDSDILNGLAFDAKEITDGMG